MCIQSFLDSICVLESQEPHIPTLHPEFVGGAIPSLLSEYSDSVTRPPAGVSELILELRVQVVVTVPAGHSLRLRLAHRGVCSQSVSGYPVAKFTSVRGAGYEGARRHCRQPRIMMLILKNKDSDRASGSLMPGDDRPSRLNSELEIPRNFIHSAPAGDSSREPWPPGQCRVSKQSRLSQCPRQEGAPAPLSVTAWH